MPWFDSLVGQQFIDWLRAYGARASVPRDAGDPFITSMRDLDDVAPQLQSLDKGTPIVHPDTVQRIGDLRNAKLVTPSSTLSPLGKRVLDAWGVYGVADTNYLHELPRQLLLVCEALSSAEPFYKGLASYWRESADTYGEDEIVEQWSSLFVQSYFSSELNGFKPMAVVASSGALLPVWDESSLTTKISSMVPAGDAALEGLKKIAAGLNGIVSRGKARKLFVISLLLAMTAEQSYAATKLAKWTIPLTSTTRADAHAAVPSDIQQLCLDILKKYEVQLKKSGGASPPDYYDVIMKRKNVIFFGPPGTGKTFGAQQIESFWLAKHGKSSVIPLTFHPSYAYEDFVWGWRPEPSDGTKFVSKAGALLEACAIASSGIPTLLLIDEINRADTARVFGELITFIEADKRDKPFRIAQDPTVERSIPSNLYVLGTMNTADRSVSLIDVALRRRFAFIEFEPDPTIFSKVPDWSSSVKGISIDRLMTTINSRLISVGVESDRAIGHALFSVTNESALAVDELRDRIRYDIYPLVVDYCFSDRTRVAEVLSPLVSSEGKLLQLDDNKFLAALMTICGNASLLETTNHVDSPQGISASENIVETELVTAQ